MFLAARVSLKRNLLGLCDEVLSERRYMHLDF